VPPGYSKLSPTPCQAQGRRPQGLGCSSKMRKPSTDSRRASLKRGETMEGPSERHKLPDPDNTTGSAAAWTSRGALVWGGNRDCQGAIAQEFLWGPSPEAPSSSCFTVLYHSINLSGVCHVRDSPLGNPGSSLRDEEAPDSEWVWRRSKRGTRQLPGITRCEGTLVPAIKVLAGVCDY